MSREECEAALLALLAQIQEGASLVRRNLAGPRSLDTMEQISRDSRLAVAHLRLLQSKSLV
jgi:hypothetical protein